MSETKTKWHKYPDEQPTKLRLYLVTYKNKDHEPCIYIALYFNGWRTGDLSELKDVIAWAELPEPYAEKVVDMHQDAITARKYKEGDPETVKALHIFDEQKDEYR